MKAIKSMYLIVVTGLVLFLASCVTTGFTDFYEPWCEENFFPLESYLAEGETPEILKTFDIDHKYREVLSNWFWCIGYSGFNGPDLTDSEITQALINLCKTQKAKLAIYSKEYTDTRSGVYSTPRTNYHYYTDSQGFQRSYTTTSYNTRSYSIERYDFSAYLFIPIPFEYRFIYTPGFSVVNLTQQDRDKYKQNTGCLIGIVYKNTPAYYANLVYGDIITKINETPIYSVDDFYTAKEAALSGDTWNITILRDGEEKQITLVFGL